ncbi:hypothetical protein CYMTET_28803 [Cymbomonas tetramitiformis]|uniref:GrpE protein homolog n=1 Tax=Cymbomonas tetramitiformis TaxID=36881 RepID=A0AAE0FMT7_9CHLO|nr:hypothetical protein CYMTET_28803 [Cymbomonas tetramitiformis]|eukprot:gene7188-8569_t
MPFVCVVFVISDTEPDLLDRAKDAITDEKVFAALKAELDQLTARAFELENLEHEIGTVKNNALRKNADFDNFRKQVVRDKETLGENSRSAVLKELLPIIDTFETNEITVESEGEQKIAGSYQGLYKQMVGILRRIGLSSLSSLGSKFDPEFHEEIAKEESTTVAAGLVLEEVRRGFTYKDRVLRPAQVKVSAAVSSSEEAEEETSNLKDVVPQEGPGEGKRRPPEKSADGKQPPQDGKLHSAGKQVANGDTEDTAPKKTVEESSEGIAMEAPGEGKKRMPSGSEMHCIGTECDVGRRPPASAWDERLN